MEALSYGIYKQGLESNYPVLCLFMLVLLGGPEIFNEMLLYGFYYGFPSDVGVFSMCDRSNGWRAAHKTAKEGLSYGIYKHGFKVCVALLHHYGNGCDSVWPAKLTVFGGNVRFRGEQ